MGMSVAAGMIMQAVVPFRRIEPIRVVTRQ
jgi:hypothetical protein